MGDWLLKLPCVSGCCSDYQDVQERRCAAVRATPYTWTLVEVITAVLGARTLSSCRQGAVRA